MSGEFRTQRVPRLFYRADNQRCVAGHVRVMGDGPGKGWMIYAYGEQAPGWALHRRWNFGLLCVHHVGAGKATDPEGWHLTFASLTFKREHRGLTIRWSLADTYRTSERTRTHSIRRAAAIRESQL